MNNVRKPAEILMQKIYGKPLLASSLGKYVFYELLLPFISYIKWPSVQYIKIYACMYIFKW